jgi:hypothetical protein
MYVCMYVCMYVFGNTVFEIQRMPSSWIPNTGAAAPLDPVATKMAKDNVVHLWRWSESILGSRVVAGWST